MTHPWASPSAYHAYRTSVRGVDDVNVAIERVRELGGTADEPVIIAAGRFANCVDDQGVQFSVFEAVGE